jgi:hypothetical protein
MDDEKWWRSVETKPSLFFENLVFLPSCGEGRERKRKQHEHHDGMILG